MTSVFRNPFRPGIGEPPPVMGRRSAIERHMIDTVERLCDGEQGSKFLYLYGPRGNGKTVLLRWLYDKTTTPPIGASKLIVSRFTPRDLENPAALLSAIGHADGWRSLARSLVSRVGIKFNLGLAEMSLAGSDLTAVHGGAPDRPLLLILDEAHTVDADLLKLLLDTVQDHGFETPVALVLAGTPGLQDALLASGASYWDRGRRLAVGRLSAPEAERVIAEPFRQAGIAVADDIATELAKAADHYPYFLQVYGKAAWKAVAEAGVRELRDAQVAVAVAAGDIRRQGYYQTRYQEFRQVDALPLARSVALAFRQAGTGLNEAQLSHAVDQIDVGGWSGYDKESFLRARGYIWRAREAAPWEPGIPSLMDHMIAVTDPV